MSKILLIRHGQASFGASDYDCLSPLGERQAAYLGRHLATQNLPVHQVIAGSMKRHQQTRDGVMTALDNNEAVSHINENWNEFDFRQVLGIVNPDFIHHDKFTAYLKQHANPEAGFIRVFSQAIDKWINGECIKGKNTATPHSEFEPWATFQARVLQGLQQAIASTPKGQNTLVFTSGGAITVVLLYLLNIPLARFLHINKELVNCGVTQLRVGKKGAVLLTMNEHSAMEHASYECGENVVSFK